MKTSFIDRALALMLLVLAGAVFTSVLWYARKVGVLPVDDAYITFRYAENLAQGRGMVFNEGERVLGSSTPLFCLLLAGLNLLGIRAPVAGDLLNLLGLIFSAGLVFLICVQSKSGRLLGLSASLLFIFFPYFWRYLPSGMETMFTIFLALLLVWLSIKEKPIWAGIVAGLLLLTRLDALSLVAGVLLVRFFKSPRNMFLMAIACFFTLLPWLIFAQIYFGAVIPHSLLAKKLIHPLPAELVFKKYFLWFLGFQESGAGYEFSVPVLAIYSFFALLGIWQALVKERWALVFVFWLIFFFAGMTYGRVGPFAWYKVPMLSGYLILVALGIQGFSEFLFKSRPRLGLVFSFIILIALLGWFLAYVRVSEFKGATDKEKANLEIGKKIKTLAKPSDKILVGEVGIIGYELLDYYVIDSAGICSEKVYQIRKKEKAERMRVAREYKWDWWGTPEWVKALLKEYTPEFIASEMKYLHLKTLISDPDFANQYQLIGSAPFKQSAVFLFQKKAGQ